MYRKAKLVFNYIKVSNFLNTDAEKIKNRRI